MNKLLQSFSSWFLRFSFSPYLFSFKFLLVFFSLLWHSFLFHRLKNIFYLLFISLFFKFNLILALIRPVQSFYEFLSCIMFCSLLAAMNLSKNVLNTKSLSTKFTVKSIISHALNTFDTKYINITSFFLIQHLIYQLIICLDILIFLNFL